MRGLRLDLLKAQQATPEQFEEVRQRWIAEVQPLVGGEQITAVGKFRHGGAAAKNAAGRAAQMGGLRMGGVLGSIAGQAMARGAAKKAQEHRAGGLPERVMLAVTPQHLYAFDCSYEISRKRDERESGTPTEVRVWDIGGIRCSSQRSGTMTTLTIDDGEDTATLTGGSAGDDPWSQDVMRALGAA
jgi:hypothetical protein